MDYTRDIDKKIARFLNGEATQQERNEVLKWVNESSQNQHEFELLKDYWQSDIQDPRLINHEEQKAAIWKAYLDNQDEKPQGKFSKRWLQMVAAFLVVTLGLVALYQANLSSQGQERKNSVLISKINNRGQKSQIQLPDGSKVWLNADSKISYGEIFSDTLRVVFLEGEAFFDVVKDSQRPFIVKTDLLSVSVLGTQFNVEAFQSNNEINVSLVEGAVTVFSPFDDADKHISLTPDNGVSFLKEEGVLQRYSKVSDSAKFNKAISWRDGVLLFDGANVGEFIEEISRWYGVTVEVEGVPNQEWNLKGKFQNEFLANILEVVGYSKGFTYEINDKKVTLKFK